jgi:hypothetical protein
MFMRKGTLNMSKYVSNVKEERGKGTLTFHEVDVCGGRDDEEKGGHVGEHRAEPFLGVVAVEDLAVEESESEEVRHHAPGVKLLDEGTVALCGHGDGDGTGSRRALDHRDGCGGPVSGHCGR